jgi:hypothetical protein
VEHSSPKVGLKGSSESISEESDFGLGHARVEVLDDAIEVCCCWSMVVEAGLRWRLDLLVTLDSFMPWVTSGLTKGLGWLDVATVRTFLFRAEHRELSTASSSCAWRDVAVAWWWCWSEAPLVFLILPVGVTLPASRSPDLASPFLPLGRESDCT